MLLNVIAPHPLTPPTRASMETRDDRMSNVAFFYEVADTTASKDSGNVTQPQWKQQRSWRVI